MAKYYNPPKAIVTLKECASLLSPVDRRRMAFRYFAHIARTQIQSDGQTYIEALGDSLQNGKNDLQPKLLTRLVCLWQQTQKECRVRRASSTRSLEDVLCYLESSGLTPDSEIVNAVHDKLRKKQSPTA
nr:MAG TPA: Endo/exonuclease (EXOG) C-terminal domain [Caudoviricetes sp.]